MLKNKSPLARADADRALENQMQDDFTKANNNKPPPRHIKTYIKGFLVTLGANGMLHCQTCTKLINLLGLRGE